MEEKTQDTYLQGCSFLRWCTRMGGGEYLIGSSRNGGAHGSYGVGDWTFMECRQHMNTETNKRKAFQEVCDNFRPVMHHFFLERFSDPADWFDKRLAYTRSVAASSMVGYIVGLGDRHSMNILIDQATAEVVHIDLGVAFEQGLMLKTPERVPFRLTRDIIDGMGVTGVEGVFRRCCEETLSVMRTNKEALLTIIEVFIHDPLYKWALSPLKAMQRQKVQQLIQDAIDPDRLCHMFPGWERGRETGGGGRRIWVREGAGGRGWRWGRRKEEGEGEGGGAGGSGRGMAEVATAEEERGKRKGEEGEEGGGRGEGRRQRRRQPGDGGGRAAAAAAA
ncbi:UNVERIFIED_CONTAM: Serine/threonine-protein kinase ATM [Sesamum radiatum]|uniref:non-specific serine/threonine protein kinase n=1 Tax=Sesamum radiatum TaxID=300843 RepID=A0AAW2WI36_SESRA